MWLIIFIGQKQIKNFTDLYLYDFHTIYTVTYKNIEEKDDWAAPHPNNKNIKAIKRENGKIGNPRVNHLDLNNNKSCGDILLD